jgi:hypothetical protein
MWKELVQGYMEAIPKNPRGTIMCSNTTGGGNHPLPGNPKVNFKERPMVGAVFNLKKSCINLYSQNNKIS